MSYELKKNTPVEISALVVNSLCSIYIILKGPCCPCKLIIRLLLIPEVYQDVFKSILLFLIQIKKVPQAALLQVRYLSGERGGGRKGFLGEFLDNLKQELNKNKEMKENIKKFREEAKKLEESDALKQARRKYVSI